MILLRSINELINDLTLIHFCVACFHILLAPGKLETKLVRVALQSGI